jgi:pimeloyl-ACP methyl ester carboxylesterase
MRTAGARGTVGPVRAPDTSGYAVRDGVRLYYEVHGSGPVTLLLLAPWAITHSRIWKLQLPYLARHFRVVSYDARGNGRSDRPVGAAAYADDELLADALAVLDRTDTDRAVGVGFSMGGRALLRLAAEHPGRVSGALFVAPALPMPPAPSADLDFTVERESYEGWQKWNAHHWRRDLPDFAEFFFGQAIPEPHSTRQREEAVAWALETDAETLVATKAPDRPSISPEHARSCAARVGCPSLVVHGDRDRIVPAATGRALADWLGCPFHLVVGGGHCVQVRHPVWFNLLARRFAEQATAGAA